MSFTYEAFYLTGFNTGVANGISGIQAKTPLYWVITGLKYDGIPITTKDYSWFTGIAIAGSGDLPEQSGYFGFDSENDYYQAVLTIDAASGLVATGCIELYWNSGVSYSQAESLTKGFDVFSNFDESAWNVVTKKNGSIDNADGQHTHSVGGANQLSDLTDVENIDYTQGYVLRADGDTYDSAQLSHSDLGSVGQNDHHRPTAINDTPTNGETTTGASSNWAYDHTQDFNAVSGDFVDVSGDYIALSGDFVGVSGDTATALQNVVEDTSPQLGGDLDLNGKSVLIEDALSADEDFEGLVLTITNTQTFGKAVYISANNTVALADKDAISTMPPIGLSVGSNKVLIEGTIREDDWDWTAGQKIYVGDDGALVTGIDDFTAGDIVHCIGIAVDPNTILVKSLDWVEIA